MAYANDQEQWPVVAYMLDAAGDDSHELHWVASREAADHLALRWATEIKQKGRPHLPIGAFDLGR